MADIRAVNHVTTNGKNIWIDEYLIAPITVMLANDIVVGIDPESDEISLMVPNSDGVYDQITYMNTSKPTLGNIEVSLSAHHLTSSKKFKDGNFLDEEFYKDKFTRLILGFYNRNR